MIYPGYLLNPGDMFTVDREIVLWATGSGERKGHLMDKIRKSLQKNDERLQFRAERRERIARLALEQGNTTEDLAHVKKEPKMSKSQTSKSVVPYEDPLKPKPITKHLEKLNQINFSWKTRNWMSAFAFIPRYLEVNQNVCSAVYLRHPVARPGLAEVPSPFAAETQTLAFQWYLRRR
jgi:ribosomal protein S4